MKTIFMLLAQFEKPVVPLNDICQEYFGMGTRTANMRARAQDLPIRAFKLAGQKSDYMVHIEDLAQHIDQQRGSVK